MKFMNHIICIAIALTTSTASAKPMRPTTQSAPSSSQPQTKPAPQVTKPTVPTQQKAPAAKTFTFYFEQVKTWPRRDVIGDDGQFNQKFIDFVSNSNLALPLQISLLTAGRSFHLLLSGKNDEDFDKIYRSQKAIGTFQHSLQQQHQPQPQPVIVQPTNPPAPQPTQPKLQPQPQPRQQPISKPVTTVSQKDVDEYTRNLLETSIKTLTSSSDGIFKKTAQGHELIQNVDAINQAILGLSRFIEDKYKDATNEMIAKALIAGFTYLAIPKILNVTDIRPLINQIHKILLATPAQVQPQQPLPTQNFPQKPSIEDAASAAVIPHIDAIRNELKAMNFRNIEGIKAAVTDFLEKEPGFKKQSESEAAIRFIINAIKQLNTPISNQQHEFMRDAISGLDIWKTKNPIASSMPQPQVQLQQVPQQPTPTSDIKAKLEDSAKRLLFQYKNKIQGNIVDIDGKIIPETFKDIARNLVVEYPQLETNIDGSKIIIDAIIAAIRPSLGVSATAEQNIQIYFIIKNNWNEIIQATQPSNNPLLPRTANDLVKKKAEEYALELTSEKFLDSRGVFSTKNLIDSQNKFISVTLIEMARKLVEAYPVFKDDVVENRIIVTDAIINAINSTAKQNQSTFKLIPEQNIVIRDIISTNWNTIKQ